MNRKYFNHVFFFFLIITLFGCDKTPDEKCVSFAKAPVTRIDGANAALINQEIILTVSFSCNNGCGQFGNFDEIISGNTSTITVIAKYVGCICTQDLPIRQTIYKFKRSQPGTYDLKFLQTDNIYLTHTIIVQ